MRLSFDVSLADPHFDDRQPKDSKDSRTSWGEKWAEGEWNEMRMAARRLLPMVSVLNVVIDALFVCGAHFGIDIYL